MGRVITIDGVTITISERTSRLVAKAIADGRINCPHPGSIDDEMFDLELLLNSAQPQLKETLTTSSTERR